MTPEKKLELARLQVELAQAQRAYVKDPNSENGALVRSLQREFSRIRLGPKTPEPTYSEMKLTPREPEKKKAPKFTVPVHRPDVEFDDAIGQWVGV